MAEIDHETRKGMPSPWDPAPLIIDIDSPGHPVDAGWASADSRVAARRSLSLREMTPDPFVWPLTIVSGGIAIGANSIGVINTANIATVIGGASELIFGTAALVDTSSEGELHHQRNLLRDIWTGENSTFVPTVWSFLNRRPPNEPAQHTVREHLIMQWREQGWLGPVGSEIEQRRIDLFFGTGGRYTIDELRARAAMLYLVETDISLMHQGLDRLIRELVKRDKV